MAHMTKGALIFAGTLLVASSAAFGHGMVGGSMMPHQDGATDPGAMGYGMMGPGMVGPGMMGPGMMGPGMMAHGMMGPGMMGRSMMGHGMMGNCPLMMGPDGQASLYEDLTVGRVSHVMTHWVARSGNPNLKLGDVVERDADSITADVVTQDGSLVRSFVFDRHTGAVRPADQGQ